MTMLDDLTTCAGLALAPPISSGACLILISTTTPASIGRTFRLEPGEHVIGRGAEVDIRIDDHGVSRKHARLARTADGSLVPPGQRTWTIAFGSSGPAVNTPRGRPV